MNAEPSHSGTRTYWVTWGVLLALTLVMLVVDVAPLPKGLFVGVMLVAMLVKASLIGGNFMHLSHESMALVVTVLVGLLVTGLLLYVLIIPDAYRVAEMTAG